MVGYLVMFYYTFKLLNFVTKNYKLIFKFCYKNWFNVNNNKDFFI
jgi:hypothetical protein